MSEELEVNELENEIEETPADDNYDFGEGFDVFSDNNEEIKVEEDPEPEKKLEEGVEVDPEKKEEETDGDKDKPDEEEKKEETDPEKIIAGLNQALAEEREKKRIAQEQLKGFQPEKKPEEQKKFNWEDPDETISEIDRRVDQKVQTVRLDLSESQAMARHDDYSEKYMVFSEMAQKNPAYVAEMLRQPDPAEWAYQQATKQISMNDIGDDPAAYRAKIEAEVRAKIEAETKTAGIEKQIEKASTVLPPSSAKLKGKTAPIENTSLSDDPLGDMWGEDR